MTTMTIRLPDDKHSRLKNLAASRGISLNKLLDEATTMILTEHDAQTRFQSEHRKAMWNVGNFY